MGSFYVSYAIRTGDRAAVAAALRQLACKAFVSPAHGSFVHAYDEASDEQDDSVIRELGANLSKDLGAAVLAVMNHDDDILFTWLFVDGALADQYCSFPGCFEETPTPEQLMPAGGDASTLIEALNAGADPVKVEAVLRTDNESETYAFALDRHVALAETLGLPAKYGTFGYRYIVNDPASIPDRAQMIEVS